MSKYPGRIVTDLAPAGYSVFFDGTGDYLQVADNAVFDLDTGDFTVEAWWYPTTISSTYQTIAGLWNSPGSNFGWILQVRSTDVLFSIGTGFFTVLGSTTITANRWYHVAATRSGTTIRVFLNGSLLNSGTSAASGTAVANLQIGRNEDGNQQYVNGYLSNVRIIKGTAVYTAAFTPPTQLFNITNTSLLTCNSPAIIDQSNNAFAITVNGNSAVSTFTPFTAYVPYNPALGASTPGVWTVDEAMQAKGTRQWNMYDPYFNLTTLLLHGNGTNGAQNNTFLDSSSNNFTITRNGNTTQGTFSPFSQTGWSNFFATSELNNVTNASTAFDLSTGNWTIEAWVYPTASAQQAIINLCNATNNSSGLNFWINSSNQLMQDNGVTGTTGAGSVVINSWNHVAAVRNSGLTQLYLNGSAVGSAITQAPNTAQFFYIARNSLNSVPLSFNGYISNVRVVKGGVLYTGSTYTVPTSPLTTSVSSGTVSLLTCQSNRFVDNSSNAFPIATAGTPSVQPFSPFYSTAAYTPATVGGSGYFDGTTDWLSIANNAAFDLGTGDCTVECWLYRATSGTLQGIVTAFPSGGTPINGWGLYINTSNFVYMDSWVGNVEQTFTASDNAIPVNAWTHIAYTRQSGTSRLFVNGRLCTATGPLTQAINTGGFELQIGRSNYGATNYVTGYISNLRIVKGTAVYTAAFTPATAPLTAITNTSLLTNFTNAGVVDSTAKNALETVGNAQISTTQSKFGGSSMFFDGNGDYLIMPNVLTGQFGTGDFTVEYWDRHGSQSTNYAPQVGTLSVATPSGTWRFGTFTNNGGVYLAYHNGTSFIDVQFGSVLYNDNIWRHFALTRQNGIVRAFVDGVQVGTNQTITQNFNSANRVVVGAELQNPTYFNGYIDELRITNGFARYTGNFTPQTSQWQDE